MNAKYLEQVRRESFNEAMESSCSRKLEQLAKRAKDIDTLRLALEGKEQLLKTQKAAVLMQQRRAQKMPIAHRWAQMHKLKALQRKVEKETQTIKSAKKALEVEATIELKNIDLLAKGELKRRREELIHLHLNDLDKANERLEEQKSELNMLKQSEEVMKTRLEHEPLKAQEQSTRELHKLQAIIQTKEHELKAEQKLIQGDADKQIEALKQAKHIDEAVEELEMDQLQKAK